MIVIGIDPGTTGAIALLCSQSGLLECERVPTVNRGKGKRARNCVEAVAVTATLRDWSRAYRFAGESVCSCMEALSAFPGMTGDTGLRMGYAAGVLEGCVTTLFGRPEFVTPKVWKKHFGLSADKHESVTTVRRLYSHQVPRVFGHDKAEAVLIAHYWLDIVS